MLLSWLPPELSRPKAPPVFWTRRYPSDRRGLVQYPAGACTTIYQSTGQSSGQWPNPTRQLPLHCTAASAMSRGSEQNTLQSTFLSLQCSFSAGGTGRAESTEAQSLPLERSSGESTVN